METWARKRKGLANASQPAARQLLTLLTAIAMLAAGLFALHWMWATENPSSWTFRLAAGFAAGAAGLRVCCGRRPALLKGRAWSASLAAGVGFCAAAAHLYTLVYSHQSSVFGDRLLALAVGLGIALLPARVHIWAAAGTLLWLAFVIVFPPPALSLHFAAGFLAAASFRLVVEALRIDLEEASHQNQKAAREAELLAGELALSQSSCSRLLEHTGNMAVFTLDPDGQIISCVSGSPEWPREEWQGRGFLSLFKGEDELMLREMMERAAQGESWGPEQVRFKSKSGKVLLGDLRIVPQRHQRRVAQILVTVRDTTQRQELESRLREIQQRYALVGEGSYEGLWHWDLRANRMILSPRWKSMLGYAADELGEDPSEWFNRIHPEDVGQVRAALMLHINGQRPCFQCQYRIRHKDDSYRWMIGRGVAQLDGSGNPLRMAGSQTDVNEFKLNEEQLLHDAFHDSLTGLANRAMLIDRLDRALKLYERDRGRRFAVLFLDLDRFKVINDSLGHEAGDQLLIATAARLRACVRDIDTVARLGGDEFTILVEETRGVEDATMVATRIHEELKSPFDLNGQEVFTSASIGIALAKTAYKSAVEILRDADTAMYRAKMSGRPSHQVFNSSMHARAMEVLQMENDLRRATSRDEFIVHYQPIVRLQTGEICGFEALVRWQHPLRGLVMPGEFLPLAEETGLAVPIGFWVLREACLQAKAWQSQLEHSQLFMSVNLSARSFSQPDLVEQVAHALEESGLDAASLNLEITESVLMEDAGVVIRRMEQLKNLNVKLHLDDFGTGYSSLSYLHRFPIDASKIDRSFVTSMTHDAESSQIVGTMVQLSKSLNMTVIAEGVEKAIHLKALKDLGCDFGQGFFYSKPLEASAAEKLMAATGSRGTEPRERLLRAVR